VVKNESEAPKGDAVKDFFEEKLGFPERMGRFKSQIPGKTN
jgi:hypothetical protein